jgi:hypothetical protein
VVHPDWRVLGQAVLVYLAIASSAATAEDSQPGRGTLAEMVAFARLGSVACQRLVPDVEGIHALALLRFIKPPLTDKEIVAKEKEVKRLRDRLGLSRWCRLYAGEMEQARILVEVLRRQYNLTPDREDRFPALARRGCAEGPSLRLV